MPWVRLRDGSALHVRVLGRGEPCLLVHGFASESSSWLPFIAPLLHRNRFIAPDLRGFGRSGALDLADPCPLTTYADDLNDVVQALRLDRVALVGISMGALSAVRCFERGHGARFTRYMHIDQGLVIHNTPDFAHGLLGAAQPAFFRRVRALLDRLSVLPAPSYARLPGSLRKELARVFAEFAHAGFARPRLRSMVMRIAQWPQLLPAFLPAEGFPTHVKIMRAYLERAYDLRGAFAEIEAPTTMLIGGASRMYPAAGQRMMAKAAPAVRVSEIAGAGHMLPLEAPRRFLRELTAFLQR